MFSFQLSLKIVDSLYLSAEIKVKQEAQSTGNKQLPFIGTVFLINICHNGKGCRSRGFPKGFCSSNFHRLFLGNGTGLFMSYQNNENGSDNGSNGTEAEGLFKEAFVILAQNINGRNSYNKEAGSSKPGSKYMRILKPEMAVGQ